MPQPLTIAHPIPDWDKLYAHLQQWANEHGHTRVPQAADVDGYPLGQRLKVIRQRHRRGTLDAWYQLQLEELPGWSWAVRRPRSPHSPTAGDIPQEWAIQHTKLQTHLEQHGNLVDAPVTWRRWLTRQHAAADQDRLTPEQTHLLAQLMPHSPTRGLARTRAFAELLTTWLKDNHKTVDQVTHTDQAAGPDGTIPLQKRILYYRARKDGREGTHPLPDDEAHLLEQIPGWTWS